MCACILSEIAHVLFALAVEHVAWRCALLATAKVLYKIRAIRHVTE